MTQSTFDNAFAGVAAAFHTVFGAAASYMPAGGSATAVKLLIEDLTKQEADNQTGGRGPRWHLTAVVLGTEIASPARGDSLTYDGRTYAVTGNPQRTDNGLDWIIEALSTDTVQRGGTETFPEF